MVSFQADCENNAIMDDLPQSVRYVKNGEGGDWWKTAKARAQVHFGWWFVPRDLLRTLDLHQIKVCIQNHYRHPGAVTRDLNALQMAFQNPSHHTWVTFQDGYLWWCTVRDGITINPDKSKAKIEGSFWLTCDRPWDNRSLSKRLLARPHLPGVVTRTAGYRGIICKPQAPREFLRIIRGQEDSDVIAASQARETYTGAVAKLIKKLHEKDFELLIDLILARSGWVRIETRGGTTEGTDIDAENVATNEIALVQVKSEADQSELDKYVEKFRARREYYQRMIFAVHSPTGVLIKPVGEPVHLWDDHKIAGLAVQLGLGEWIAKRR